MGKKKKKPESKLEKLKIIIEIISLITNIILAIHNLLKS